MAYQIAKNIGALLTVLHIIKPDPDGLKKENDGIDKIKEKEYLKNVLKEDYLSERLKLEVIESDSPLNTAIRIANQNYDLVVVGMSETWGIEPSSFSRRHEKFARECPASLLILRKYSG
jgi:nucleotide-binding universal stress UspA family protein